MIAYFYAMMVYATTNLQQQDGAFSGDVLAIILVILLASVLVLAAWLVIVGTFTQDERFFFWKSAKRRVSELRGLGERALGFGHGHAGPARRGAAPPYVGAAAFPRNPPDRARLPPLGGH